MSRQEQPQGEEKQPITTEELRRVAEQLKKNVEDARIAKEESIKKKLTDHESLVGQYNNVRQMLGEAKETLNYFTQMQEKGEITEPEDLENLEKIKESIKQLEEQKLKIEERSEVIATQPEIGAKLHEEAGTEDKERTGEKMYEQIKKELYQEATEIALTIKELAAQNDDFSSQRNKIINDYNNANNDFKGLVDQKMRDIKEEKNRNLRAEIFDKFRACKSTEEFRNFLEEKRKTLGMFRGKEKAAIDSILSEKSTFENLEKSTTELEAINKKIETIKGHEATLKNKYQEMITKARKADQEIKQKFNYSGRDSLDFDVSYNKLENELKKMANIKYWEGRKEMGGKYKDWDDAGKHEHWVSPLYHEWRKITRKE